MDDLFDGRLTLRPSLYSYGRDLVVHIHVFPDQRLRCLVDHEEKGSIKRRTLEKKLFLVNFFIQQRTI